MYTRFATAPMLKWRIGAERDTEAAGRTRLERTRELCFRRASDNLECGDGVCS
jgi:hypothetical protein